MDLTLFVLAPLGLALLLPLLSMARPGLLRLSALLPLALFAGFLRHLDSVRDGEVVTSTYDWLPSLGVQLSLRLDGLSLLMALLITGMGALVFLYSNSYMAGRQHLGQFYAFLMAFMASMIGLVLADNVITLFVFWELTSITSFLLIGFENDQADARKAATQALLVTGGGGLGLLGGLVLLGEAAGTYELSEILQQGDAIRDHAFYAPILVLVLFGAFTKSAQAPFHFWLPSAMAAPTPVSAYLHSATMVKAGIYLLARLSPVLSGTDGWLVAVTAAGGVTLVVGAVLAVRQRDLKLILAYSTVSSLGLLVALLGLGTPEAAKAAIAFLLAHALYKGGLFLVAGIVDHETGTRDYTRLGGLARSMPLTTAGAFVAAASLAGVAPLLAFVGKEAVLEATLDYRGSAGLLLTIAMVVAGALYTVAAILVLRPFFGARRGPRVGHEAPPEMTTGPIILAALSLVLGLFPAIAGSALLTRAMDAVTGEPTEGKLALWHGFNLPLLLSIVSLVAGLLLAARHPVLLKATSGPNWAVRLQPAKVWDRSMSGLVTLARTQTRLIQNGDIHFYISITLLTSLVFVALPLVIRPGFELLPDLTGITFYELAILVITVVGGLTAVMSDSRLGAVAALGVVGFGVAVTYALFGAPDLAMTQFLVETLTVLLFVLVFYQLPRMEERSRLPTRLRDAALSLSVGGLMAVLLLAVQVRTLGPSISQLMSEAALPEAFGRNVVNVIIVDFRALDTMGEIVVLSVAALGVVMLLKLARGANR